MYTTDLYEGMLAETVSISGANGDALNAYFARPLGAGPVPAVVLIHHLPGWDEYYREAARRFAHHGYAAISPDLYHRLGSGTPEDVAAMARGQGGVPDDQVIADVEGARQYLNGLPYTNGKVGLFGTCSGGRHAFLVACRTTGFGTSTTAKRHDASRTMATRRSRLTSTTASAPARRRMSPQWRAARVGSRTTR